MRSELTMTIWRMLTTITALEKISDNVAKALILNPNQVIPVSNYFEETTPTAAKNAMSLYVLWRVCKAGEDYIKRKWGEDYIRPDFKR